MKTFKIALYFGVILILSPSFKIKYKDLNEEIIGVWVYKNYNDSSSEYKKKNSFDKNEPGIKFKRNGKLIKRQNVGWCGTPPITYDNFQGTWKITSDSTLTIRYKYWDGMAEEDLLIVELNNKKLIIESTDYRREKK